VLEFGARSIFGFASLPPRTRAALLLAITELLKIVHEMFEAQTPS
jgi:hypothetical protein